MRAHASESSATGAEHVFQRFEVLAKPVCAAPPLRLHEQTIKGAAFAGCALLGFLAVTALVFPLSTKSPRRLDGAAS